LTTIPSSRRFRKAYPCPICHGYDEAQHGTGKRGLGYLSDDGAFAHCTRDEHAVPPPVESFKNRLITIGLDALARSDWDMVRLITTCIQGGGLRHV
jgi:hypothetical protein